ncbi:uncharacterized protein MONOS_17101 [Monocercomonoides exilis]|uniref:uncharacterized protein n=1 Tax=Monocercomonoides exilis TaxID=2049356 RepID=UPI003559B31C|nr:hypothetical protein MONOS_17101 [Monocercomonoides exilis]
MSFVFLLYLLPQLFICQCIDVVFIPIISPFHSFGEVVGTNGFSPFVQKVPASDIYCLSIGPRYGWRRGGTRYWTDYGSCIPPRPPPHPPSYQFFDESDHFMRYSNFERRSSYQQRPFYNGNPQILKPSKDLFRSYIPNNRFLFEYRTNYQY